jgi:hypothetical protein
VPRALATAIDAYQQTYTTWRRTGVVIHDHSMNVITDDDGELKWDPDRWRNWRNDTTPAEQTLNKMIRRCAAELRLPYMKAHKGWTQVHKGFGAGGKNEWQLVPVVNLQVRRQKRAEVLVAPLMLVGSFKPSFDRVTLKEESKDRINIDTHRPTNWFIEFRGPNCYEAFDDWLQYLRDTPECRDALRLTD